jgi:hypothetical protein
VTENSATVDGDSVDPLIDLHKKVMANVNDADQLAGQKIIMFYGSTIVPYFDGVYAATSIPFKKVLQDVLGAGYRLMKMPEAVTPSGANGWLIANLQQTKLHYTVLPQLKAQGINEENMYSWHNFMMGSCMLEVLASGGVIKQPATVDLGE